MNKRSITATDLFLAILAVSLIGVSFYQTWLGLEQIFGGSSFVIALVLSLMLLFLLWQLRVAKNKGNSTTALTWIYFFFASFCFIANFNNLYTRFMKTGIYTEELRKINDKFNFLDADVKRKLNYAISDDNTRKTIASKTEQLKKQIVDPGNPGYGTRARQLATEIERLLGQKLTLLAVANGDYNDLALRMETQISDMMDQLSPAEKDLKIGIENGKLYWNKQTQKLLLMSSSDINDIAQGEIDKSIQEYNGLVDRAKSVLGDEKVKIEHTSSNTQDVGKIGYAFAHAINNFGMYQFVVLMGCILLDFGIMLIILLVPTDNSGNHNSSVFTTRRSGKTLIPNN